MAPEGIVMKVAHIAVVTPHLAGLYETTRDLVAAERAQGLDARIVDPVKELEGADRGVPIVKSAFAADCQVLVNHSGLGTKLKDTKLPIIHVIHGRPYSTFLLEQAGKLAALSHLRKISRDERYKLFVTFWPEFIPYFSLIIPQEKLHTVPPPVDLKFWTPNGPSGYKFHGHKGKVNVVCADIWRQDKDPYHVINAFGLFARQHPESKLHVYAAPQKGSAWQVLKDAIGKNLGEVCGFIKGLDNVYRAADLLITPHRIATRSVRESLACGCTVVMDLGGEAYTGFCAPPEDLEWYAKKMAAALRYGNRKRNRKRATEEFDSHKTAKAFIKLIESIT
jgi:glycosyltransferase involved in cell wall biosynthesis